MEHVHVHGERVPALGFGTARLFLRTAREGVRDALEAGYRHIDTARMYVNEGSVGKGLRDARVDRDEVFLVTKIPPRRLDRDNVHRTVARSLKRLGTHIDLLLVHWPNPKVSLGETLEAMRREQEAGRVRHLGVSNFDVDLLGQALEHAPIVANQVEFHVHRPQDRLVQFARERDVMVTAYSPLGTGKVGQDPVLREVAAAHGKSPFQVALRWLVQQPNVAAIPKARRAEHRRANLDIFDFTLTDDEMARIGSRSGTGA